MAQSPESLILRPRAPGDALSESLRGVRLTGALYYRVSTSTPWPAIGVPSGTELIEAFGGHTRNVVSYHVMVAGSCWVAAEGGRPIELQAGEVVVFPHGDAYVLSCRLATPLVAGDSQELLDLLRGVATGAVPASFDLGAHPSDTTFVCGFLGCDPRQFDPLLTALPPMICVRDAGDRLTRLVDLALTEVQGVPGAASVRERLSESMFLETVREYVAASGHLTWLAGIEDPMVARALAAMHEQPDRRWTLASLADQAGASRSVFAEHFGRVVGEPAMQYLSRWRLRLAQQLLAGGDATVSSVAATVGYGSEAAFSRAFKRQVGLPPGAWRAQG